MCVHKRTFSTFQYVAPEIILNKGHDHSVDAWSLGSLEKLNSKFRLIISPSVSFTGILIHELLIGKPPFRGKTTLQTYNLILRGIDCIQLSQKIPKKAQLLIKRLCRQMSSERLGVQKNGINDIKAHQWFADYDWDKVQARKMPAPLILPVKNNLDLSNFEEYPKDYDEAPDEMSGWDCEF